MGLLHPLSYAAILAAFAFMTLSFASGLLYVSELIEERSRLAKIIGQRVTYAIIALHAVLYFTDSLPFFRILFSALCHVVYLQNFSNMWPLISLSSWSFVGSCVLVLVDHFLWFFYFSKVTQEARDRNYHGIRAKHDIPGFAQIATFFGICVWLAPLFLFLSLSANDHALPTSGAHNLNRPDIPAPARGSLFKTIYDFLPLDALPRLRQKNNREGLIAPQTTYPQRMASPKPGTLPYKPEEPPSRPRTSSSAGMNMNTTPRGRTSFDAPPTYPTGASPRLSSFQAQRRVGVEGVGLGLRQSSGSLGSPG